jgi:hypothetical protein
LNSPAQRPDRLGRRQSRCGCGARGQQLKGASLWEGKPGALARPTPGSAAWQQAAAELTHASQALALALAKARSTCSPLSGSPHQLTALASGGVR